VLPLDNGATMTLMNEKVLRKDLWKQVFSKVGKTAIEII
jgi:hypothetical protein